jgi:hypothetical protein
MRNASREITGGKLDKVLDGLMAAKAGGLRARSRSTWW